MASAPIKIPPLAVELRRNQLDGEASLVRVREKRCGTGQQCLGRRPVLTRERAPPGSLEPAGSLTPERFDFRDGRSQLPPVCVRLLQVVPEDLFEFLDPVGMALLDPAGMPHVKCGTKFLGKSAVAEIPGQQLSETISAAAARALVSEEGRTDERTEEGVDVLCRGRCHHVEEGLPFERSTDDGRMADQRLAGRVRW